MTREERATRVGGLQHWIRTTEAEWEASYFLPKIQETWDANTRELEEHRQVLPSWRSAMPGSAAATPGLPRE